MHNLLEEIKKLDVPVQPIIERWFACWVYREILLELIADTRLSGQSSKPYEHLLKAVCDKIDATLVEIEEWPLEIKYTNCVGNH